MSDIGDDFRALRDESRKYKQNNRDLFQSILDDLKDTHEIRQLTAYQYRIDGILDIYPSNRKWHLLPSGERGQFRSITDIKRLLG